MELIDFILMGIFAVSTVGGWVVVHLESRGSLPVPRRTAGSR